MDLHELDRTRIDGVDVPDGWCVTTAAFRTAMATLPAVTDQLDRLSLLRPDDRAGVESVSAAIRATIGQRIRVHGAEGYVELLG